MKKEIAGHVKLADEILQQIGDLDKSLPECDKTQEDDVMFVGSNKAFSRPRKYGHITGKVQNDIYPTNIRFEPNGVLSDMIQKLQSLGTVANNRPIHSVPK